MDRDRFTAETEPDPSSPEIVGTPRDEQSDPDDPDGLFDSQDMPTADGEMTDGGAEGS